MTIVLPNVRKLFIPDPGYVIFDADLSGADAQVVAWEAEDEKLKTLFREGKKVHAENARDIFGDEFILAKGDTGTKSSPKGKLYDQCKRAVHATNYGARASTLSKTPEIGWTLPRAEGFQSRWFSLHPGIEAWHRKTDGELRMGRRVRNRFGYHIIYFDRIDLLLPQALAWIAQSTVALVSFYGALQLERLCPWVEILLQVHDSLVFQVPRQHEHRVDEYRSALAFPVPYPDPLTIPWSIAKSSTSWGDCKEIAR